jgi:hypothetical protein
MRVTLRSRGARLAGVLALAAMLTLAGCGGARVSQSGAPDTAQQAGQDAGIQAVQSASQDVQDITAALTAAQIDASFDYASQENETQP